MAGTPDEQIAAFTPGGMGRARTIEDLAHLLRELRRREARRRRAAELTYRELAVRTGWSHTAVGQYLTGRTLPPTNRFDILVRLLGATHAEQGALATVRDRVEEQRRAGADDHPPVGVGTVTPRQLPPGTRHFTGRAAQLAALTALAGQVGGDGGATTIAVVDGPAGAGKSALAVHWAHRAAGRFPDGQLYVNLRRPGAPGAPVDPAEAVRGFLDALGVAPHRVPPTLAAKAALYRSLTADRRLLVVIDNADDADQVRPLLPGSPGCLVVVTSRARLTGLIAAEDAQPVTVDLLPAAEARQLLSRRLGADRVAAEPAAVDELAGRCARLPLALTIASARATGRPGVPLAGLVADLRAAAGLDAFAGGDPATDLRTVLSWSYRALADPVARLFRLLGLHVGPDVTVAAAARLADCTEERARLMLADLAGAHLVAERAGGRFAVHDLTRAYAAELAQAVDSPAERRAALHRMCGHEQDPETDAVAVTALRPGRQLARLVAAPPVLSSARAGA